MDIVLYHGSNQVLSSPSLNKSKANNDFGHGLYCTDEYNLAGEWACKNNNTGFINTYSLNSKDLEVLNLFSPQYTLLHWITLLMQNRAFDISTEIAFQGKEFLKQNYSINLNKYDLVYSYRADDSYFGYAQSFLNNTISIQQLSKAMHLGNLGKQIVLISESSFSKLRFVNAEPAIPELYYKQFVIRDLKAREDYKTLLEHHVLEDTYLIDIMRAKKK